VFRNLSDPSRDGLQQTVNLQVPSKVATSQLLSVGREREDTNVIGTGHLLPGRREIERVVCPVVESD